MKKRLFLVFIIVILMVFGTEAKYNDKNYLTVEIDFSSGIDIIRDSPGSSIKNVVAEVYLFPKDDGLQSVLNFNPYIDREGIVKEGTTIKYEWDEPSGNEKEFGYRSLVKVRNSIYKVKEKVEFPITDIDEEYKTYLKSTEYIDINNEIRSKANELASGEDDLYKIVYKVGKWTRDNIEYDSNSLTEKAVQPASWVLRNKEGVCDEITNLFIALLRSVGIPARFVSGVAYTNLNNVFGNHGWAEVYFPNHGWIPFDVTYGQYGWIDPTHIKLSDSLDPGEASIKYSWEAKNVELESKKIEIGVKIIEEGNKIQDLVELKVRTLKSEVAPGSYVPIKINIKNLQDFYIALGLHVTKAPELIDGNVNEVFLRPHEEKNVFWIVKIPDEAKKNYIYTTVFEVMDMFGGRDSDDIVYALDNEFYSKEYAEEKIKKYEVIEEKTYSSKLDINCKTEREYYYIYEDFSITCELGNIGNVILNNINICYGGDCKNMNLNIAEFKAIVFDVENGTTDFVINAKNKDVDVNEYLMLNILENPNLKIVDLQYPKSIAYKDIGELKFILRSDAPVKNIVGKFNNKEFMRMEELRGDEKISLSVKGKELSLFNELKFEYEDENGRKYSGIKTFSVEITDRPWYAEIILFFKNLF
jgi:hypothetical protein